MKKSNQPKTRKLFLLLLFITLLLTPVYAMFVNGYIWEIEQDSCIGCGTCVNVVNIIELNDNGLAYFSDGTYIGNSSVYLDYSPHEEWFLVEALEVCPVGAIIKTTY